MVIYLVGQQWQVLVGMERICSQTIVTGGGMKTLETFVAFRPLVAYNAGMLDHDIFVAVLHFSFF